MPPTKRRAEAVAAELAKHARLTPTPSSPVKTRNAPSTPSRKAGPIPNLASSVPDEKHFINEYALNLFTEVTVRPTIRFPNHRMTKNSASR